MLETVSAYAGVINALMGVAILGVLINLSKKHSEILKERLEGAKEQSEYNRQRLADEKEAKNELKAENEKLRVRLEEALSAQGITLSSIVAGTTFAIESKTENVLVQQLANQLEQQSAEDPSPTPEIDLELAKAEMAQGNWEAAGRLFDRYVGSFPDSFEVQFARGVAWANTRENDSGALRAYNESIALLPSSASESERARVFIYRGAVLKRLGRLEEANADLLHALGILRDHPAEYELDDLHYNLAAVAALRGDRLAMLRYVMEIKDPSYADAIEAHFDDYFKQFKDDVELDILLRAMRPA